MPREVSPDHLRRVRPRPLRSTIYRIVAAYRDRALSLEGSLLVGGRYKLPFEFGALYGSQSPEICWAELEAKHEGPLRRGAFHIVTLAVQLRRVLDLTDPTTCDHLGLTPEGITRSAEYTVTRAIARAARAAGFEAILAPSSAGPGAILAIFTDRLGAGSTVTGGATRAHRRPPAPLSFQIGYPRAQYPHTSSGNHGARPTARGARQRIS